MWKTERRMRSASEQQAMWRPCRRTALATGTLATLQGFWGSLSSVASALSPVSQSRRRAKSVILIFNCGAPSHTDLWDMKPEAPSEVRGEYSPIATNVSGIEISELLPEVAKRMDRLAVVRTLHHSHGGHNSGMYWSTVGKPYRIDSTLINPSRADVPCFGTLVNWLAQRDGYSGSVPPYVITPQPHCD
ncbi:MAG: DUF1501 domain-containing protein, partial [Planctomycetaceae bacterium]|nr:DUF1501 domain-containing protein [Planctomycetaceae bacterium]